MKNDPSLLIHQCAKHRQVPSNWRLLSASTLRRQFNSCPTFGAVSPARSRAWPHQMNQRRQSVFQHPSVTHSGICCALLAKFCLPRNKQSSRPSTNLISPCSLQPTGARKILAIWIHLGGRSLHQELPDDMST